MWPSFYAVMPIFLVLRSTTFAIGTRCISPSDRQEMPVFRIGTPRDGAGKGPVSGLHSDRTSCHTFEANHFRFFLHSVAYVLMHALTEIGLYGTSRMNAQFNTLQYRILNVAGKVCKLNTIVRFHLPISFPLKHLYGTILYNHHPVQFGKSLSIAPCPPPCQSLSGRLCVRPRHPFVLSSPKTRA